MIKPISAPAIFLTEELRIFKSFGTPARGESQNNQDSTPCSKVYVKAEFSKVYIKHQLYGASLFVSFKQRYGIARFCVYSIAFSVYSTEELNYGLQ